MAHHALIAPHEKAGVRKGDLYRNILGSHMADYLGGEGGFFHQILFSQGSVTVLAAEIQKLPGQSLCLFHGINNAADQFLIFRTYGVVILQDFSVEHDRGQVIIKFMGNMAAHLAYGLHPVIALEFFILAAQKFHALIDLL